MLRNTVFSVLIRIGLLITLVGCQSKLQTLDAVRAPGSRPLPVSGTNSGRLGAAALLIVEQPGANLFSIKPVEAETGGPILDAQPVILGGSIAYGFSRDRSQMAFLSNQSEGCLTFCLRVMDLRKWEEIIQPIPVEKSMSAWFIVPEFDQTGSRIPLILNNQNDTVSEILLVDKSQAKVAARSHLKASIYQAVITPEGTLAVHGLYSGASGTKPVIYLALLDPHDLRILWEKTLPEVPLFVDGGGDHSDPLQDQYYEPARIFSPDGSRLYIVAADQPLLVTVDYQKQTITKAKIQPRVGWLERLLALDARSVNAKALNSIRKAGAISPDGRYLYVVGEETRAAQDEAGAFETERIPLGLAVIDPLDGTLMREVETEANDLLLSQDGKMLLLRGWQEMEDGNGYAYTVVKDITTWDEIQRIEGMASPSRLLDGSLAWLVFQPNLDNTHTISLYRPGDPSPRSQINQTGYVDWIVIP